MEVASIMQEETSKFLENLSILEKRYGGIEPLANKLGVSRRRLDQIKSLEKPGGALESFVDYLVSEATSSSLTEAASDLAEDYAARLGLTATQFIEQCVLRFGQKTFEALEQRNIPRSPEKPKVSSVTAVERAKAGAAAAFEAARRLQESPPKRKAALPNENKPEPTDDAGKDSEEPPAPPKQVPM